MSDLSLVAAALDRAHEPGIDVPPAESGGDGDGDRGARKGKWLPEGCPVTALGTEGGMFYFLTTLGELRGLTADKVANKHILGMFAPDCDYLFDQWPRKKMVKRKDEHGDEVEEWIVTGWRTDDVSMLLMDAAATRGVWNAQERVRGRGAWTADDGSLILHLGTHVLMHGRWLKPGMYEGKVYPAAPALPKPHPDPVSIDELGPGHQMLNYFRTWNWARPSLDPILLLGWIVAARMGAAIEWRPMAWITGDKATGKSTLQKLVKWTFDGALLQTTDATEAGIRQILGQQSLPVAVDEAEASEDNRKLQALLNLARQAASGGIVARGGQDHQGHQFQATSAFLFSSIYTPPMLPQDRSRMALLELGELQAGQRSKTEFTMPVFRELGAQISRVIADRWHEWPKILEAYRDALIDEGGQGGRAADQFGTLLAAAHLVIEDGLPHAESLRSWGAMLNVSVMAETAGAEDDKMSCLQHLMTYPVMLERGGTQRLVSEWLLQATSGLKPGELPGDEVVRQRAAAEALARIGVRVASNLKGMTPGRHYLAVASRHQGLARIYEGTHWQGRSGAEGVWAQALKRISGAMANYTIKMAGTTMKATLVPLEVAIEQDADEWARADRELVE
ncbi:hypothetical protein GV829_04580 [Sphingomonas lacunae]|uniref:DUF927 domain-containing protein n=1 Tax=Sphingomonas lacunae TaxID=2698828 RepID=A0A6M4AXV4_9SPHN|nr:hypothetical protein [Sphingomonas lacunae]QJQ31811.1 hypothetical protein GV829_04580 [Sphingomonas lacunae]